MALSDIITKIKDDATAEAKRIEDEARDEAKVITDRAEADAQSIAQLGSDDIARAKSKAKGRIVAGATHEAKFAVQRSRVALIEQVFSEIEKNLKNLPKEAYGAFVVKHAEALPEKKGVLTVSSERKAETIDALKKAGVDTSDVKESQLLGGFILETNSSVYDHSLRSALNLAREERTSDVAHALFGA